LSINVIKHPDGCLSSRYGWWVTLDAATSAKITAYRPRHAPPEWDAVAGLVRALVAASARMAGYDVERLLHATARLAIWCERSGLPRDADVWLRHETIDAFILTGCTDLSPRSAQTYRAWLRRIRAALAWAERGEQAPPAMTAPTGVTPPYSSGELAGLHTWAEHLPDRARADALALMTLAGGCGLAPGELAQVRGSDIRITGTGPVVIDAPALDRLIVARACWENQLAALAEAAGDAYLFRPGRTTPHAKNLIGSWCSAHRPGPGLPAISARRLRSSWIVELLSARIDTNVVAAAAGLASPAALARYQHFVPPLDEATAAALLRGHRR
jgi:integrase